MAIAKAAMVITTQDKNRLASTGNPLVLCNRDFQLPNDNWYQITPKGEFPHLETKSVQIVDADSISAMVNRFNEEKTLPNFPGLLVDFDHFSHDRDKSSEAAGWVEELQNRDDGLWAKIRWSDLGEQAVKGGRFRMVSPTWLQADCQNVGEKKANRLRPMRLDRVALTNDPNLKGMVPLSNRAGAQATDNQTKLMNHKEALCNAYGLKAEATDAEIQDAISKKKLCNREEITAVETERNALTAERNALKTEKETLTNRVTGLEASVTKLNGEVVEADLITFGDVIENKDETKKLLLANRDATVAALKLVKKPAAGTTQAGATQLHNRGTAGQPGAVAGASVTNKGAATYDAQTVAKISNRAQELMKSTRGLSYLSAHDQASRELAPKS